MKKQPLAILLCLLIASIPFAIAQPSEDALDTEPPHITYFTIYPEITATTTEFDYQAIDYGQLGDYSTCSGIKKVEFSDPATGNILATQQGTPGDCVLEERLSYTPLEEGRQTICARAYDYNNQPSNLVCAELTVVKKAPDVQMVVFADSVSTVSHLKPTGDTLDVHLLFENKQVIDKDATRINVEKLTGIPQDWRNVIEGEGEQLVITGVDIVPTFTCEITSEIVDVFGNKAQKTIHCDLKLDNERPKPLSITTDLSDIDGAPIISTRWPNTITAHIQETGIGFNRGKKVYLDLTDITRQSRTHADHCEKKEDIWECTWKVTATTPSGGYTITLSETTEDDYGNRLSNALTLDVDVSNAELKILDIQHAPAEPTITDELIIQVSLPATVIEPVVTINAEKITTNNQKNSIALCETDGPALLCIARIKNLKATEQPEEIIITAKDHTTTTQAREHIHVYGIEEKTRNYFKAPRIYLQPLRGIDRKTASLTEHPVSIGITWTPEVSGINILTQSITCEHDKLANTELFDPETKNPTLLLKFDTRIAQQAEDTLKIPCTAQLILKKGNSLFQQPEIKQFTINVPLYNSPLGTIEENLQKIITDADKDIEHVGKQVEKWEDVDKALGKIVGIGNLVAQMDSINGLVTLIVYIVAAVLESRVGNGLFLWTPYCKGYTASAYKIKKYLISPGYFKFSKLYTYIKLAGFIYGCHTCARGGLFGLNVNSITGDMLSHVDGVKGRHTTLPQLFLNEWDPKKSIHVAQNCFCPSGIEYNLRKEQQLRCIYRNCVKERAQKGLPVADCDRTLKEQTCLYIDSAAWKLGGGASLAALITQQVYNTILSSPIAATGEAWAAVCDPTIGLWGIGEENAPAYGGGCEGQGGGPPSVFNDYEVPTCSTWASIVQLLEINALSKNKFDWDAYNADLMGTDYCATNN